MKILYRTAQDGPASYSVYTADGRLVRTVDLGVVKTGEQEIHADLRDLDAATYFIRLSSGGNDAVTKVSLVR